MIWTISDYSGFVKAIFSASNQDLIEKFGEQIGSQTTEQNIEIAADAVKKYIPDQIVTDQRIKDTIQQVNSDLFAMSFSRLLAVGVAEIAVDQTGELVIQIDEH